MQIYLDNEKNTVTMVQSVASASTMISSVAIEAKDFVVSKFPKNFFKHIYVDTSQTITQINYNADQKQSTENKCNIRAGAQSFGHQVCIRRPPGRPGIALIAYSSSSSG